MTEIYPFAAVAGRRIDMDGTEPARFPLQHVPRVRHLMTAFFQKAGTELVVCSAACGADLIALDTAAMLGIRSRIVLPFSADAFRAGSVIDRPGNWGPLYDRLIAAAHAAGDLVLLEGREGDDGAYAAANTAIINEVTTAARGASIAAVAIWDGNRRSVTDATGDFLDLAGAKAFHLKEIRTN